MSINPAKWNPCGACSKTSAGVPRPCERCHYKLGVPINQCRFCNDNMPDSNPSCHDKLLPVPKSKRKV